MIQEKDFLYRVPVKTEPITTPRGQIRNPEILVDLEGGEFMHGNILDANSTNKLINQSVKDAVDDKFIESVHVTKDLLEAETSARTKGDEDLSAKVQAEQTRAEGKEKEISDKLAIVDGDSNTEGSFRKAIADVIAAAPEDLDTLKEIADKLAGNDDLHTALNQAITEKADASALANEVSRATGAESGLQAAIATKADAAALEGAKTEFDEKIDNLKFIPYNSIWNDSYNVQHYTLPDRKGIDLSAYTVSTKLFGDAIKIANESESLSLSRNSMDIDSSGRFYVNVNSTARMSLSQKYSKISAEINDKPVIEIEDATGTENKILKLSAHGITLPNGDDSHVLTSNAGIIDITQYALKTELPTVPTKTSQLTNDSNFIAATNVDDDSYTLQRYLKIGKEADGQMITIGVDSILSDSFVLDGSGITFQGRSSQQIPTAGGDFINISDFASAEDFSSLRVGLSKKQNKITVNTVDVTDIKTADVTKLRTIVTNLINALSSSGLINATSDIE